MSKVSVTLGFKKEIKVKTGVIARVRSGGRESGVQVWMRKVSTTSVKSVFQIIQNVRILNKYGKFLEFNQEGIGVRW